MPIAGRQLGRAIAERSPHLEGLPPADFVSVVVGELDALCRASLPRVDERLCRQGRWANGDAVDLIYCRPSLGRGVDVSWSIRIEARQIKIQVATSDFGRGVIEYVQEMLGEQLSMLASVCICAARADASLKVFVNDAVLPIEQLAQSLQENPAVRVTGSAFSFSAEVSANLESNDVPDVQVWIKRAIQTLTPIYLVITPPLSVFIVGLPEKEEAEYPEGAIYYRIHRLRERNPAVIAEAKAVFRASHGNRLYCEVCGFDFLATYGQRGRDFAEGHHTKSVSRMGFGETTKASDICIVCSNCHRMLHRPPFITPEDLRAIVTTQGRSSEG